MTSFVVPTRKERLQRIPVFCRVEPLARPRSFTPPGQKYSRIYQPKENQRELLAHLARLTAFAYDQPVIIDIYINIKRAKTSKMNFPIGKNHGDEDNLRKATLDAMVTNGHLKDDSLVVGGQTMKFFGEEDFTVIDIFSINAEPTRYEL